MGNKKSKQAETILPEMLNKKVIELFKLMDKDGSNTIERKEAKEYWKKNFSQVNAIALFDQVDVNGDGTIELQEWLQHWIDVYKTDGNAWVNLDNVDAGKGKITKLKKEGKY